MSLRQALRDAGKTQRWLADQLGVSQPAVNQWVTGKTALPPLRREQIEKLLGWVDESHVLDEQRAEDLEGFYQRWRTPLAYLLRLPANTITGLVAPEAQEQHPALSQEEHEYALRHWGRYLGLKPSKLLCIVSNELVLPVDALERVYALNIGLTYLGEHLGEPLEEAEAVALWLRSNGPWHSFHDLEHDLDNLPRPTGFRLLPADVGRGKALAKWEGLTPTPADKAFEQWRKEAAQ